MSSPFNENRYGRLMEGLEAVEIRRSELNSDLRFDAQFFQKAYLAEDSRRKAYPKLLIGGEAFVTDGPHGYHELDDSSPIAMLTAKCARGWFASREGADLISKDTHNANLRSSLDANDLILSTRGTVGLCGIVEPDVLPANIDQDVARIVLHSDSALQPKYLLAYLNSRFGQDWMVRYSAGMVQQGLSLEKVRNLPVPRLSDGLQDHIALVVDQASKARREAANLFVEAEQTLLEELGLTHWTPPEPLTYQRSAKSVFQAGRYDSEYFAPRVQELIKRLSASGLTVGEVAPVRRVQFSPKAGESIDYIEISDVTQYGEVNSTRLDGGEAPSRATWHVSEGDLVTSTVRPIRRLTAMIRPEQDNFVCSSGFVVLQPRAIPSEVLLMYFRLPLICELMDLHTTASMYPAISVENILALPFVRLSDKGADSIVAQVKSAGTARQESRDLLERATRGVEVAIEDSETAALKYLGEH